MITTYVFVGIVALIGLAVAGLCIYGYAKEKSVAYIVGMIITVILTVAICAGMIWWLYNTESGKRAIKDTKSNISGGIERTITVYDIDGDVIEQYSGKFDVAYDSERIKFDDENGKRHIIYYTTGTVVIDEK